MSNVCQPSADEYASSASRRHGVTAGTKTSSGRPQALSEKIFRACARAGRGAERAERVLTELPWLLVHLWTPWELEGFLGPVPPPLPPPPPPE